ncbi:MAG: hypothetical protein QOD77_114 [Thermoplasmata archaeon]|jgi:hypothetical protein|nr:hypothetical protein [Thermoplasmata archaeon]
MDFGAWWNDNGGALESLGIYAVGIAAYTLVVTALYVPLGHRVMLGRLRGTERVATRGRTALYFLLFPLISFSFFLVVVSSLLFLSSTSSSTLLPKDILTIGMGTVIAIRLVAYFHENAAQELGKIMPLGLLGVVLVTNRVDSLGDSLAQLKLLIEHLDVVGLYFTVMVLVEFTCRGIHAVWARSTGHKAKAPAKPATPARPAFVQRK